MSRVPEMRIVEHLDPEKVAYWYFRLNGFLQIENFAVHPVRRGSRRTDADLLAVQFRFVPNACLMIRTTSSPTTRNAWRYPTT